MSDAQSNKSNKWYSPVVEFFDKLRGPSKKDLDALKADEEFVSAGVPPEELGIFVKEVEVHELVAEEPLPLPKPAFMQDATQAGGLEDIFPLSLIPSKSLQIVGATLVSTSTFQINQTLSSSILGNTIGAAPKNSTSFKLESGYQDEGLIAQRFNEAYKTNADGVENMKDRIFSSAPSSVSNLEKVLKDLEREIDQELEYFPTREQDEVENVAEDEEAVSQFARGLFKGLQERLSLHIEEHLASEGQGTETISDAWNDKFNDAETDEADVEDEYISSVFHELECLYDDDEVTDTVDFISPGNIPRILIHPSESLTTFNQGDNTLSPVVSAPSTPSLSPTTSIGSFSDAPSTPPTPTSPASLPTSTIAHLQSFAKVLSATQDLTALLEQFHGDDILSDEESNEDIASISPSSSDASIYSTDSADESSDCSNSSETSALQRLKAMRLIKTAGSDYNPTELLRQRLARCNKRHGVVFPSGFSPNDGRESLQFTKSKTPSVDISEKSYILGVYQNVIVRVTPDPRPANMDLPIMPIVNEALLHPYWMPRWESEDYLDELTPEYMGSDTESDSQEAYSSSPAEPLLSGLQVPLIVITQHDDVVIPLPWDFASPRQLEEVPCEEQSDSVVSVDESNLTSEEVDEYLELIQRMELEPPRRAPSPPVTTPTIVDTVVTALSQSNEAVAKDKSRKVESPVRVPSKPSPPPSSRIISKPPTPTTPKTRANLASKPATPQAPKSRRIRREPFTDSDSGSSSERAPNSDSEYDSNASSSSSSSTIRPTSNKAKIVAAARAKEQQKKTIVPKPRVTTPTRVRPAIADKKNVQAGGTVASKRVVGNVASTSGTNAITGVRPSPSPSATRSGVSSKHLRSSSLGKKENINPASKSTPTSKSKPPLKLGRGSAKSTMTATTSVTTTSRATTTTKKAKVQASGSGTPSSSSRKSNKPLTSQRSAFKF